MLRWLLAATLLWASSALASTRILKVDHLGFRPPLVIPILSDSQPGLPVWFLPHLGISVQRAGDQLILQLGKVTLRYGRQGWNRPGLAPPQLYRGVLHLPLSVVLALGIRVLPSAEGVLDLSAPRPEALPPRKPPVLLLAYPPPAAQGASRLTAVTDSVLDRGALQRSRLVLQFSAPTPFRASLAGRWIRLQLQGARLPELRGALPAAGALGYETSPASATAELEVRPGSRTRVFWLSRPFRIVLDTRLRLPALTPPVPADLPGGIRLIRSGSLSLVAFSPKRYRLKLVSQPLGQRGEVGQGRWARGGVAAVNGGYFNPPTGWPVDLVFLRGLPWWPSLDCRATLGITAAGSLLFGIPHPTTHILSGSRPLWSGALGPAGSPAPVSLAVSNGFQALGRPGQTTLLLAGGSVWAVHQHPSVYPAGQVALSFSPAAARLPERVGVPLRLKTSWGLPGWSRVTSALAAGPWLVRAGHLALDAAAEGFARSPRFWQSSRQVAVGLLGDGDFFLAYDRAATPEAFAEALLASGARSAMRLDSGASASLELAGGYLNRRWGRPVPNSLVVVPRGSSPKR